MECSPPMVDVRLSEVDPSHSRPSFVEVLCKSSGKVRRFSAGTDAAFALFFINKKLDCGTPSAWLIEAVKEGEEPVNFSPKSLLIDYGDGWNLQTVTELQGQGNGAGVNQITMRESDHPFKSWKPSKKPGKGDLQAAINIVNIGKVILVFVLMFLLAAFFTLALENLPRLLMFIDSIM